MRDEIEDYLAEDGEVPWPVLRRFVKRVLNDLRRDFAGFRKAETAMGTTLVAEESSASFEGAFLVSLRGPDKVRIGPGTVNARVPVIDEKPIDGLDEEGLELPEGVPDLDCSEGPGNRLRSYVCVRVIIDPETGAMDVEDPETLQVVHRPSLHESFSEGGAPDENGIGDWPLAQLEWSEDGARITRARQWVYFEQTHRFVAGEEGRPGRHFFRPHV